MHWLYQSWVWWGVLPGCWRSRGQCRTGPACAPGSGCEGSWCRCYPTMSEWPESSVEDDQHSHTKTAYLLIIFLKSWCEKRMSSADFYINMWCTCALLRAGRTSTHTQTLCGKMFCVVWRTAWLIWNYYSNRNPHKCPTMFPNLKVYGNVRFFSADWLWKKRWREVFFFSWWPLTRKTGGKVWIFLGELPQGWAGSEWAALLQPRPRNHLRLDQLLCISCSRCVLRDANGVFNIQPFAPSARWWATTRWIRKPARTGR